MPIADFFAHIRRQSSPDLTAGSTDTVGSFFEACVSRTLPRADVIEGWNNLLNWYVNEPDAVFFVRRNASGRDAQGNWNIRRGFLTKHPDGFQYVFVDNSFSMFFYSMAINNIVPEKDDFKQFILSRQMRCGSFAISMERQHRAYKTGSAPVINSKGWKLSHIFSANADYDFDYADDIERICPLGSYDQFVVQQGSDYPYRRMDYNLSAEDKAKVKAHFLRVVHPINYFLSPQRQGVNKSHLFEEGSDIGEYSPLLTYCRKYLQETYGPLFLNYEASISSSLPAVTLTLADLGNAAAHVQYGYRVGSSVNPDTPARAPRTSRVNANPTPRAANDVDHGKAAQRIPGWACHPERYNHRIIKAFLACEQDGNASLQDMIDLCSDPNNKEFYVPTFMTNYRSMRTDAGHSHGKVFEDSADGYVVIWPEIADVLEEYRELFEE